MRRYFLIPVMILTCTPASAQQYYAAQAYPAPAQPQTQPAPGTMYYAGQPAYVPQATPEVAPQQPPAAQQHTPQAQPWDYGQSVVTDIRQMNF